jgi:hypothetical protein
LQNSQNPLYRSVDPLISLQVHLLELVEKGFWKNIMPSSVVFEITKLVMSFLIV